MKVVHEFYRVSAVDNARAKPGHVGGVDYDACEISIWENEGGAVAPARPYQDVWGRDQ